MKIMTPFDITTYRDTCLSPYRTGLCCYTKSQRSLTLWRYNGL